MDHHQIAGEIIRAVGRINHNYYTSRTLSAGAELNFLAMVGVFDSNDELSFLRLVGAIGNGKAPPPNRTQAATPRAIAEGGAHHVGHVRRAVEHVVHSAIEFILAFPDLEHVENTTDMLVLYQRCDIDFMQRAVARRVATTQVELFPEIPAEVPLHQTVTPKIDNKSY